MVSVCGDSVVWLLHSWVHCTVHSVSASVPTGIVDRIKQHNSMTEYDIRISELIFVTEKFTDQMVLLDHVC